MKKKLFSCFHPLVLETETETDLINVDSTVSPSSILPSEHNKKGLKLSSRRSNSKRPFSQILDILLLKASLKIKVSDRNVRQLSFQSNNVRLRRIYKQLQISGDDRTRRDRGVEESKASQTEIRSPKNTRSIDHEERRGLDQFGLMAKPCSCKMNAGLYLLLVTLFFTVVWGRVRAVLFALLFLYSLPMWAGFLRLPENVKKAAGERGQQLQE